MIRSIFCTVLILSTMAPGACSTSSGPRRSGDPRQRDTARAERLTREAAELVDDQPLKAERMLVDAIAADFHHGPAHNNLGVIYLAQDRLYEAASEFEWARKLMPGHPDPRLNLGLTLERGHRIDEAIDSYRSAINIAPEHLESNQALARCQLRHNRIDAELIDRLKLIAMHGIPAWSDWAIQRRLELEAFSNQP